MASQQVLKACCLVVVSSSLQPHGLQHARLSCPTPTPGACSNSCPSSLWFHPTISSSVVPFSSCPQSFPASVFSNESALHIRWPKYWSFSFSISPSNEYSGLISFRMDWLLSPCSWRDSQESSPKPWFKSINSSVLSFIYGTTLTSMVIRFVLKKIKFLDYLKRLETDCR